MKQLVIIGASGQGKVVADIAKKNGYTKIVFLDDNELLMDCNGYNIIGKCKDFINFDEKFWDFFIAIGNAKIRQKLQKQLEKSSKKIAVLIHPNATIAENVILNSGTVVMAGAVINPNTVIGKGCIINTSASVDHDCIIEDFVHISVGAHIAGTVHIESNTCVGAGTIVSNNISICSDCTIGAGAVVVKDIKTKGTYVGVPAKRIK